MKNSKKLLKTLSILLAITTLCEGKTSNVFATTAKGQTSSVLPRVLTGLCGFSAIAALTGGLAYKWHDSKQKEEKLKLLETKRKKLETELEKAKSEKSGEYDNLKKQFDDAESERKKLEAELEKAKSEKSGEYDSLKKQFDDVESQRKKLEADLREAKTSKSDEYEKLKKQFEQLESKRKELEEKLKKSATEKPLQAVPQKSTAKSKKISDLEERCKKLEKELQQAEVNIRTLSARYDDATKIVEKLRREKPDIDGLLQQQREEFRETIRRKLIDKREAHGDGTGINPIKSLGPHSQGSLTTYEIYILSAISSDFVELVKYPSKDIEPFCDEFKGYMPGKRIEIFDIYNILKYFNNFMIADKGFVQLLNSKDHFRQDPIPEDKYERFLYCLANILKKLDDTYEYRDPMDKFYFFKSCELRDIMRYSEIEKYLLPKSGLDKT